MWGAGLRHDGRPEEELKENNNTMTWRPVNLSEFCPPNSTQSACSSFAHLYLNLLVHLYGGSKDERIQQKRGESETYQEKSNEYDFIVVGAGAAGCVVANRLTENPKWKVLLLEAGPEQPDVTTVPGLSTSFLLSNIDWSYTTEPNGKSCLAYPRKRCIWSKGKMMGGSSSINSMTYIRGNKVDYDGWAEMGNKGWSYEEVLPFFKKSEHNLNIGSVDRKYHGLRGPQYISLYPYIDKPSIMMVEASHERGLPITDYNGREQEGTNEAQAFMANGERVSTNTGFIQPIRYKRKNLYIEINSEAKKILIAGNKKAYGVIYEKDDVLYTAFAKKEVIISAGSVGSPKLLMLSGIGPKQHLEDLGIPVIKDLAVGENLQDHVTFDGIVIALPNGTSTLISEDEVLEAVEDYHKMKIKTGPLSGNGPVNALSFIKTDPSLIAPDIQYQMYCSPFLKELLEDLVTTRAISIFPTSFYEAILPRIMNLVPKSKGVILLNATNPNGPPLIYPNYLDDESDFEILLKGIRFVLSLENTDAFRKNGAYFVKQSLPACKDYDWGTDEYFKCIAYSYTATAYHPVGTCKMGPKTDKNAVLDNELRVYGVGGLRVIDASMMPRIVRGNTNAPSIMIGERGVDFIIKHWRRAVVLVQEIIDF